MKFAIIYLNKFQYVYFHKEFQTQYRKRYFLNKQTQKFIRDSKILKIARCPIFNIQYQVSLNATMSVDIETIFSRILLSSTTLNSNSHFFGFGLLS